MSQIASAAHQNLDDYRNALKAVLEDVDKTWLTHIRDQNLHPGGIQIPTDFPEDPEVEVGLEITIPGDLIQRVSTARLVNPQFTLSERSIIHLLFPEITSPIDEQARRNAEEAMRHPVAQAVNTIQAWRQEAARLREARADSQLAELYEKAAGTLEAQISQGPPGGEPQALPPQRPTRGLGQSAPAGEIIPREFTQGVS